MDVDIAVHAGDGDRAVTSVDLAIVGGGCVVEHIHKAGVVDKNPEGAVAIRRVQEPHPGRAGPHNAGDNPRQNGRAAAAGADPAAGIVVVIVAGIDGSALAGVGQGDDGLCTAAIAGVDRTALAGVGQGNDGLRAAVIAGIDRTALAGVWQRDHRLRAGIAGCLPVG